jgi:hypothetical protein
MRRILAATLLVCPALAGDWETYSNWRFGIMIDVPPGMVAQPEPANNDGRTWYSADGQASLLAWGNHLVTGTFGEDSRDRIAADKDAGWTISYETHEKPDRPSGGAWHVYSGEMKGRILYAKSIASCGASQAIHFRLEYPAAQQAIYGPIIKRLVKTFRAGPAMDCKSG